VLRLRLVDFLPHLGSLADFIIGVDWVCGVRRRVHDERGFPVFVLPGDASYRI
jgi:hypothetical protein